MDAALVGVLGGLAGAKLLYVVEHWAEPLSETLLSRGGMSWFGGFTGGVLAGLAMIAWQRLPLMRGPGGRGAGHDARARRSAASAASWSATTTGGRRRCRGASRFPQGLPPTTERVHPTQLYEAVALFAMTGVLVALRKRGCGRPGGVRHLPASRPAPSGS